MRERDRLGGLDDRREAMIRPPIVDAVLVVAVIGVAVGFTAGILTWFLASPSDAAEEQSAPEPPQFDSTQDRSAEIELGEFDYRFSDSPDRTASSVRVLEFRAVGVFDPEAHDFLTVADWLSSHDARIRAAIARAAAATVDAEVRETDLKSLRARICRALNDLCGRRTFEDVVLSEFVCFDVPLGE